MKEDTIVVESARAGDANALAQLHNAVADDLTVRFGDGHWSHQTSARGVLTCLRTSTVLVARKSGALVATLRLQRKKPWAIDPAYFTKAKAPLYLLAMAVAPRFQNRGIGRQLMLHAVQVASMDGNDAIRLDAYDAPAGAGDFYRKCGMTSRGRVVYRGTPLEYFELLLPASTS